MPRGRVDASSWNTSPSPQTPLQRSAFIDTCTLWLTQEPPEDDDHVDTLLTPRSSSHVVVGGSLPPRSVYTLSEIRIHTQRPCFFCARPSGAAPVVANPYAQRHLVLTCDACRRQHTE